MGLVHSQTDSGLVIAEESADEAAVARALKQLDPTLELTKQIDPAYMRWVYKVHSCLGSERPPVFITDWRDKDGTPRDLTFSLVDRVRRLDRNSRSEALEADRMNDEFERKTLMRRQDELDALRSEYEPALKSNRLAVPIKEKPWQTAT